MHWRISATVAAICCTLAASPLYAEISDYMDEPLLMLYVGMYSNEEIAKRAWESATLSKDLVVKCAMDRLYLLRSNLANTKEYAKIVEQVDITTDNIAKSRANDPIKADEILNSMNSEITSEEMELYNRINYSITQMIFLKSVLDVIDSKVATYEEWSRSIVSQRSARSRKALETTLGDKAAEFWRFIVPSAREDYPFLLCFESDLADPQ